MVKHTENTIKREIDKLNENESLVVLDFISDILSARIPKSKDTSISDDLILSLSNAQENKRARQVVEWERVRRKSPYRSA